MVGNAARERWEDAVAGLEDALQGAGRRRRQHRASAHRDAGARRRSQAASGALQAAQAGNQLLALQAQQLADLTPRTAAQNRAQALEAARAAWPRRRRARTSRRFLDYGSGYQPAEVRMFGD